MQSLTGLELASGDVFDLSPDATGAPVPRVAGTGPAVMPLSMLENAALPAVLASPCVVSFSGGKDSALVLAVAARVARREGLPLPIPVSWRFPDVPRADESSWQDRVLAELGIEDRVVLTAGDDLDLVGPVARSVLSRHGVVFPANLHLHEPILAQARGGALLTGLGGDQILTSWSAPGRMSVRRAARMTAARSPGWVQGHAAVLSRSMRGAGPRDYPWLRPDAARQAFRNRVDEWAMRPDRPSRRLPWESHRRRLTVAVGNLASLGADHDVMVVNPLLDNRVHASLLRTVSTGAVLNRSALIRLVCQDQISPVISQPRTKGWFRDVFVRTPTLTLARGWDGLGTDESLVDPVVLADLWRHLPFPPATGLLLQQAWIDHAEGGPTNARASAGRPDTRADTTDHRFG